MEKLELLAKIEKCNLSFRDTNNILILNIHVEYEEGMCQNIAGICLDTFDKNLKNRIGTAYGCEMIRLLLEMFQVDNLSELNGKYIYVYGESENGGMLSFKPQGFRALKQYGKKDLNFKNVLEKFNPKPEM